MSEVHLVLSPSERELLVRILGALLKEKRGEVRRTELSREFRHQVEDEAAQIHELLDRLSQAVEVG